MSPWACIKLYQGLNQAQATLGAQATYWATQRPARALRAKRKLVLLWRMQRHAGRLLRVVYVRGTWGAVLRLWHTTWLAVACVRAGAVKHGAFDLDTFLTDE